jgi:tetratricopeptide (TPR) repeat protein
MADHAESHSVAIIEAAVSVFHEILTLRPTGHEKRAEALGDLGNTLFQFCFSHEGNHSRSARCFHLLREALQLCPPGHASRHRALHNLARALQFVGYEQQSGNMDNLRESILLNQAALHLRPADHPERVSSLANLASGLMRSFQHSGDLDELAESIVMQRQVLQLTPYGDPRREASLHNLSVALECSFMHQGGSETLAEAINVSRESLQLQPAGHPSRWMTLTTLGNLLGLSFASTGFPESLQESLCCLREALQLMHSTHPERGLALSNLADILVVTFRLNHDCSTLAEAITLLRQSLGLPVGHYVRSDTLNHLAQALTARFDDQGSLGDLHEAMNLYREVLQSLPPGPYRRMMTLQRLGRLLCRPECQSWTEAFALYREALDICPRGSPFRAQMLSDTSICFLDAQSPFFNISQGVAHLLAAYSDNFCHVNRRLRSAISDLQRVESAYAECARSLDDSTLKQYNSSVLDLYAQVIGLLPRAAHFSLDHSTRLQAVTGLDIIARDAAARAIILGRESQALEMLEEGRGVFWAQTLHLRASAFDDVPQEDSQNLRRLLGLLEYSARRVESSEQTAGQRERDLERRRRFSDEAEALIFKIRGYAGLNRFLMPPVFHDMVGALPDGFVVIVNASQLGYHALLLHRGTALATSLKLQPPPMGFDSATLKSNLPRDVSSDTREGIARAMRKDSGRGGSFLDVLAMLWTSIVRPVVLQLGLQVRYQCPVEE